MCDYSLHHVKSRPAKVGDKLTTHNFNTGTRGFAAPEDANTAVCVLPGTELAFAKEVRCGRSGLFGWKANAVNHTTAIFRQINKDDRLFSNVLRLRRLSTGFSVYKLIGVILAATAVPSECEHPPRRACSMPRATGRPVTLLPSGGSVTACQQMSARTETKNGKQCA